MFSRLVQDSLIFCHCLPALMMRVKDATRRRMYNLSNEGMFLSDGQALKDRGSRLPFFGNTLSC